MLITIQEYADKHGVDKATVQYHLRKKNISYTRMYGKRLINSRAKYPESTAGRPKRKSK